MAVSPTYPGVYVEEIPSGVRTIVGVGTSTALFIGRAKEGPLYVPTLVLSANDFERIFSNDTSQGDLPRAVNLFYANGGTQAWIMRIAQGAGAASMQLENEAGAAVLTVTAKSAGVFGNNIRVAITYNSQDPEGSFDLRVFDWQTNSRGQTVQSDIEYYPRLSMDPNDGAYAPLVVNNASALIQLTDIAPVIGGSGTSRAGRVLPDNAAGLTATLPGLFTPTSTYNPSLLVGVDGKPPVAVDLSGLAGLNSSAAVVAAVKAAIDGTLSGGSTVTVSAVPGPIGPGIFAATFYLQIASANGDVRVAANDLAVRLMFGAAQGGLELPRSSVRRPAPTGSCTLPSIANLVAFGSLTQTALTDITINGKLINSVNIGGTATPLHVALTTVSTPGACMFQDAIAGSLTGNLDGIREKFGILATAINQAAAADPKFTWSASVVGHRLVLTPTNGPDNAVPTIASTPAALATSFELNARYYNLGLTAAGPFEVPGAPASDGNTPQLTDFASAYPLIDKYVDLFNLMVLPRDVGDMDTTVMQRAGPASVFCQKRRALLLLDAPTGWSTVQQVLDPTTGVNAVRIGVVKDTAALYFPRLQIVEGKGTVYVGSTGAMAGVMARIDGTRGVWKAPAGTEADIRGIVGLKERLSDDEHGQLNPRAVNVARVFPDGIVSWGARTMDGDDDFGSEYKYIPVRRLAYFLEESLVRGLKWVVFEPNAEPLWAQIRLNVGAFMQEQFRKGAFAGTTPATAYFVKCDSSTTTQADQNLGVVNIIVGFAPLEPAEFVIIQLQQMAGQLAT
jgi:phage tail sheath protein FI